MEKYQLVVDFPRTHFDRRHDPYNDYINKRYPSLESAVKSAQFIMGKYPYIDEVDVCEENGMYVCSVEDANGDWENAIALPF